MGGLADLLFFGLLLWFVFRAAGRAAEEMRRKPDLEPGGEGTGGERSRGERPGIPGRPAGASARTGEESFRERLMEELRHWEAEQRARFEPGEPARSKTEAPGLDFEGRSLEVGAQEPDFEGRSLEIEPAEPIAAGRTPREARRVGRVRGGERTRRPARGGVADDRPVTRVSRAVRGTATAPDRGRGVRLPDLSGYTPVERAVLWGEILGPPRGLRED